MAYDRDELAAIGERFVTRSLTAWATEIVETAGKDGDVLRPRGITEPILKEVKAWTDKVKSLEAKQEIQKRDLQPLVSRRQKVLDDAINWREELKGTVAAVFDSEPDVLARFRTGVKISRSIPKMYAEFQRLLPEARSHLPLLMGAGLGEGFLTKGETLLTRLDEALKARAAERAEVRPATEELYHAQGVLYTKVRFIARLARTAFRTSPQRAGAYGYATLRRGATAAKAVRTRQNKV